MNFKPLASNEFENSLFIYRFLINYIQIYTNNTKYTMGKRHFEVFFLLHWNELNAMIRHEFLMR